MKYIKVKKLLSQVKWLRLLFSLNSIVFLTKHNLGENITKEGKKVLESTVSSRRLLILGPSNLPNVRTYFIWFLQICIGRYTVMSPRFEAKGANFPYIQRYYYITTFLTVIKTVPKILFKENFLHCQSYNCCIQLNILYQLYTNYLRVDTFIGWRF